MDGGMSDLPDYSGLATYFYLYLGRLMTVGAFIFLALAIEVKYRLMSKDNHGPQE